MLPSSRHDSPGAPRNDLEGLRILPIDFAVFWLAIRTVTFWVFIVFTIFGF